MNENYSFLLIDIYFSNDRPTERSMAILIEIYLQFVQMLPIAISKEINGFVC